MSKKSCPFRCRYSLYKNGHDFLDIQYYFCQKFHCGIFQLIFVNFNYLAYFSTLIVNTTRNDHSVLSVPRRLDPFNVICYKIHWVKTSWTYSICKISLVHINKRSIARARNGTLSPWRACVQGAGRLDGHVRAYTPPSAHRPLLPRIDPSFRPSTLHFSLRTRVLLLHG